MSKVSWAIATLSHRGRAVSRSTAAARAKGMPTVASLLNRSRSRTSVARRTVEATATRFQLMHLRAWTLGHL